MYGGEEVHTYLNHPFHQDLVYSFIIASWLVEFAFTVLQKYSSVECLREMSNHYLTYIY